MYESSLIKRLYREKKENDRKSMKSHIHGDDYDKKHNSSSSDDDNNNDAHNENNNIEDIS